MNKEVMQVNSKGTWDTENPNNLGQLEDWFRNTAWSVVFDAWGMGVSITYLLDHWAGDEVITPLNQLRVKKVHADLTFAGTFGDKAQTWIVRIRPEGVEVLTGKIVPLNEEAKDE